MRAWFLHRLSLHPVSDEKTSAYNLWDSKDCKFSEMDAEIKFRKIIRKVSVFYVVLSVVLIILEIIGKRTETVLYLMRWSFRNRL